MADDLPFHPAVQRWFADNYDTPTRVQQASWPVIARGDHVLITAPTGSGKTLTAFLWSLSEFAKRPNPPGHTRVLYISPLKALNSDIKENLLNPLAELHSHYDYPPLTVQTRSGDTSSTERQRMLRKPPDILITTPESLGLLLTSTKGRQALSFIDTVILDEIHALVDNRRGAQLMVNLERLAQLSGEFQRIALSATVAPLSDVATYVAGFTEQDKPRAIQIVDISGEKQIDFRVRFPAEARDAAENGLKIWEPLAEHFRDVISENQSTLFFTNSRRLAEKVSLKINQDQPTTLAYAHHGSLARDVRTEVESRLKAGELQAIVATSSLEMGIDIGALDEVVMIQSPPSVAATLQRLGRAGHGVGETSIGTLYPTHAHDLLEAAALAEAVSQRDIEPVHLMQAPLDILAQIIITLTAAQPWPVDQLFALITRATPYHKLTRTQFEQVVEMLAGRYEDARIRELKPRLRYDRIAQTVHANRGALLAFYSSGGSIPDRGYFQLRHFDSGAILGEFDEEFVWEATVGQTFSMGTQHWQIHRITHNDVLVRPAKPDTSAPPFWRSEFFNRSYHFSARITDFLASAENLLANHQAAHLVEHLVTSCGFDNVAAAELVDYLQAQRSHTNAALPHRFHLLLELVQTGPAGYSGPDNPQQLVIHSHWGGQLNQPWSLALQAAWRSKFDLPLEIHADNDAIVMQFKGDVDPDAILNLVTPANFMMHLRTSLEGSGFFGARFRECAGRALLLTKQRFNQRLPLWMSRMQAKKLMSQVKKLPDFPVLLETWRTCLDDEFDIPALMERLGELQQGEISWTFVQTPSPSAFARNLTFGQVSRYMYADDTPDDDSMSRLDTDVITQALANSAWRPSISLAIIREFEAKRQRRALGYEPSNSDEWNEWLKERILIPAPELPSDASFPSTLRWIDVDGRRWATHVELLHHLFTCTLVPNQPPNDTPVVADSRSALDLAKEILSFYGPLRVQDIELLLPQIPAELWRSDESWLQGQLVQNDNEIYWCDAENYEILLRFQRASRRVDYAPEPAEELPNFWARLHQLGYPDDETNQLYALENLRGYACAVNTWLFDLLPARLRGFAPAQMDETLAHHAFSWQGSGKESLIIAYPEELALFARHTEQPDFLNGFSDPNARYTFDQIADNTHLSAHELNAQWWPAVWQGLIHADSLKPLQQAAARKFELTKISTTIGSRRRLRRAAATWSGSWALIKFEDAATDALSALEDDKERVRLLLDRYGFVCREIVNREQSSARDGENKWRWRNAFRALRIMELSGEVVTGHFFTGLSTPQFITQRGLQVLQNKQLTPPHYWVAANDPVSPCGLSLAWPALPQRRAGNYLAFHAGEVALVIESYGKNLTYHVDADNEAIDHTHALIHHLVEVRRMTLTITTINDQPARSSPYLHSLTRHFNVVTDHKNVSIEPSFPIK